MNAPEVQESFQKEEVRTPETIDSEVTICPGRHGRLTVFSYLTQYFQLRIAI